MTVVSKDKQIELLANAIGDIAKNAMIISPYVELTGPQVLMVAGDISEYIQHLEGQLSQLKSQ